jgi:hypothetical protein
MHVARAALLIWTILVDGVNTGASVVEFDQRMGLAVN